MKYLYIEKRQRIETTGELSRRAESIKEAFEKLKVEYTIGHFEDLSISFDTTKGTTIEVDNQDILSFDRIIFGGHHLNSKGYEVKRMIVDLVDTFNANNPERRIVVQNSKWIKSLPFYSKLSMAKLCLDHGLPHLATYYDQAGMYRENLGPLSYPVIAKHVDGENDLVMIDGKEKVKKNVFKVETEADWNQDRLAEKNLPDFLIQEFTNVGEDFRYFVANGEVVGGWKRVAGGDNFMTVTKGAEYFYDNSPSEEITSLCKKASDAWGVNFMALDFIYMNQKPYILEFSMNPGFHAYITKCQEGEPADIAMAIVSTF